MIRQIEPWIDASEEAQLRRIVETTYVTEGPLTEEFEARIRELTGAPHAIAYANGTLAEFAILKALGIGPGDEVIVPDVTFIASCNAVILAGARPVLADVSAKTLALTAATVEPLINSRTKAILPVHLYGGMAELDELLDLAARRGLTVIEDAAQAVGVRERGRHAGTQGIAGFLSFYGNKTITTGEGGVILTADDAVARACYRFKNHGRDRKGVFVHDAIGYNFSFTDLHAAIGIAQMEKLPEIIRRKAALYELYKAELSDCAGVRFQSWRESVEPVHWFTNILVDDAERACAFLAEKDIQTRRLFYPLNLQPCYKDEVGRAGDYRTSQELYRTWLSLPSSAHLPHGDARKVAGALRQFCAGGRARPGAG